MRGGDWPTGGAREEERRRTGGWGRPGCGSEEGGGGLFRSSFPAFGTPLSAACLLLSAFLLAPIYILPNSLLFHWKTGGFRCSFQKPVTGATAAKLKFLSEWYYELFAIRG